MGETTAHANTRSSLFPFPSPSFSPLSLAFSFPSPCPSPLPFPLLAFVPLSSCPSPFPFPVFLLFPLFPFPFALPHFHSFSSPFLAFLVKERKWPLRVKMLLSILTSFQLEKFLFRNGHHAQNGANLSDSRSWLILSHKSHFIFLFCQNLSFSFLFTKRLEQPSACPDHIYEIMLQCWQTTPTDRPDMETVHGQLHSMYEEIIRKEEINAWRTDQTWIPFIGKCQETASGQG